jgi:type IV secretory pathway TrbD component
MRHSVDVPLNDVLNKSRWKGGLPWQLWLVVVLLAGAVMAQVDVVVGIGILVLVPMLLIAFFKQDPDIVGLTLCSVAQRSYYDPAKGRL